MEREGSAHLCRQIPIMWGVTGEKEAVRAGLPADYIQHIGRDNTPCILLGHPGEIQGKESTGLCPLKVKAIDLAYGKVVFPLIYLWVAYMGQPSAIVTISPYARGIIRKLCVRACVRVCTYMANVISRVEFPHLGKCVMLRRRGLHITRCQGLTRK